MFNFLRTRQLPRMVRCPPGGFPLGPTPAISSSTRRRTRAFDVSAAPDQCFSTQEGANRTGFALAPVPAGSDVAGGSSFVPSDAKLERQCTEAARRLRFQVPCPKLLPVTPMTSGGREAIRCDRGFLFSTDCVYADTFFLKGNTFVFAAIPTSTRHVGIGYFIITPWRRGAAPPSTGRAAPLECPTGELARTRESPGGAVWLSCSAWAGREETAMSVLRWTNHRTTIHVGIHGHPPFDAEIAATIADYLEYVGIDSSAPEAR